MTDDDAPADSDDDDRRRPSRRAEADARGAAGRDRPLKDQMLRYAAEAENTKRRAEREANDARAYAIQKFARDLLGVADNLARALQHAPADADDPLVKNLGRRPGDDREGAAGGLRAQRAEADRPGRGRASSTRTSTRR